MPSYSFLLDFFSSRVQPYHMYVCKFVSAPLNLCPSGKQAAKINACINFCELMLFYCADWCLQPPPCAGRCNGGDGRLREARARHPRHGLDPPRAPPKVPDGTGTFSTPGAPNRQYVTPVIRHLADPPRAPPPPEPFRRSTHTTLNTSRLSFSGIQRKPAEFSGNLRPGQRLWARSTACYSRS